MCPPARLSVVILLCAYGLVAADEPKRDRFGDPLPEGAAARLGSVRWRAEQPIFTAVFTADGKMLATLGSDHHICLWDRATGKEVRRVHVPAWSGMPRFSTDGKTLILGAADNTIRFIDTTSGAEQRKLSHSQPGNIRALDLSRDGKTLAAIHGGMIVIWDVAGGKPRYGFKGLGDTPLPPGGLLALTPDGKQLVLPHADGSLRLVDTVSGKTIRAFEAAPATPGMPSIFRTPHPSISPDGRYLALSYPTSNRILVHDLTTGKSVRELTKPPGTISHPVFTPNSRFLAVESFTEIRLFGVLSGKEIRKLSMPSGLANILAFSPDGRTLAAFRNGHMIYLWDMIDGRQPHPIVGHEGAVKEMAFFPDCKRLVSAGYGSGMIVWDIASGRSLAQRRINTSSASLAVDADGESVRFADVNVAAYRWDPRSGREERQQALIGQSTNQLALSPDGRNLAGLTFGRGTRQWRLYDLKNNKSVVLPGLPAQGWISHIVFAPDSRRLAAASQDGVLRLWERDGGKLVREFKTETPGHEPRYLAFAADGRCLALFDGALRIREIAGGGDRLQIPMPTTTLFSLAYSPDSRFLASGQSDGSLVVHSAVSGKQLARWRGKQGMIRSLAFSRDSRLLASGGENGTILIWKVPDDEALPAMLTADEAAALWQTLAGTDAADANRALARLTAASAQALPLIKERFRTMGKSPGPELLARLIADLDGDTFKVRERATRELSEIGSDVADALRAELANDPSPEVKRRIETLLNRFKKGGHSGRLRGLRAIEVLERIGTPQAKELLRELAEQPLSAELRQEVQASLRRLHGEKNR